MLNGKCRQYGLILIALLTSVSIAAQSGAPPAETQPQTAPVPANPVLHDRPEPVPLRRSVITAQGSIHLDLVVTGADGKPVTGLEPPDFKLLDNGQPRKILSFRSFDGIMVKPSPPVEVILVVDTVNIAFDQVAFERSEIKKFLQQNGGRLAQPVSLMVLTDKGLRVQPRPSVDGNALLSVLNQVQGGVHSITSAMGSEGALERLQLSLKWMAAIAENEVRNPGRKILIWIGPGWPTLDRGTEMFPGRDQLRYFDEIIELSTKLRESRLAVYSVSALDSSLGAERSREFLYKDFLKPVTTPRQADSGDLGLKVLAIQSGGRILGPDNNLVSQINQCIADANAFYTISFNPPKAEHPDEYHDLKVEASPVGSTVRTTTGYYDQPPAQVVTAQ